MDAGLLYKDVKRLDKVVTRCCELYGEKVCIANKNTKKFKKKLLEINKVLRRRSCESVEEVRVITRAMAECAKKVLKQTHKKLYKFHTENKKEQQT